MHGSEKLIAHRVSLHIASGSESCEGKGMPIKLIGEGSKCTHPEYERWRALDGSLDSSSPQRCMLYDGVPVEMRAFGFTCSPPNQPIFSRHAYGDQCVPPLPMADGCLSCLSACILECPLAGLSALLRALFSKRCVAKP